MSSSCSICLESFTARSDLSATPCGHVFHTDCITKIKQELLKMTQELEKANVKLQNFTKHSVYWIQKAQKAEKKLADPKFNSQNLKRKNFTDQNQGEGTSSKMKEKQNPAKNCK